MKTITKVWEDAVVAANVCKKKIVEVGMREELSVCEAPIMKIIWESNPDISVPELDFPFSWQIPSCRPPAASAPARCIFQPP